MGYFLRFLIISLRSFLRGLGGSWELNWIQNLRKIIDFHNPFVDHNPSVDLKPFVELNPFVDHNTLTLPFKIPVCCCPFLLNLRLRPWYKRVRSQNGLG